MRLISRLRRAVPPAARTWLLRNSITWRLLRACIAERQRCRHPWSRFAFHFSGHRNIGWAMGGLSDWEKNYFLFCRELFDATQPGIVWDIGANVGIWTLFFAERSPPVQVVVAYEPDRDNGEILRLNIESNGLASLVEVRAVALSSEEGQATFMSDPFTGSTGSLEESDAFISDYFGRTPIPVPVARCTVDGELARGIPAPDFVKIDVERHEYDVLLGATRLLEDCRPNMLVEFGGQNAHRAFAILKAKGYRFFDPASRKECGEAAHELAVIPDERVSSLSGLIVVSSDSASVA